jgi:4-carboxymuconolactone decarboxylase
MKEQKMKKHPKAYQQFRIDHPEVYAAYEKLGETASNTGPLDAKTRELIKIGMAAASQAESSVQSHTHRALEAGATADEIEHAIVIGVNTISFSSMMAALTWAKAAIADHK